ncbi:MAG TPA: hypothetical protein VJM50_12740 [Pyrinomonadaceae bacterium]|nr:hypothetical protein [Pyrinomonadaceae bacterium]
MKAVLPILLLPLISFSAAAQEPGGDNALSEANSLAEVRNMQSALLVVFKSRVLELQDRERAIIQDVLKADPEPKGRNRWVYNIIAGKLNKYIRKYKSLIPARALSEADYVIYFNVVEFRRILYTYYPYGELFVIVKGSPEKLKPPRVVWRTKKMLFAEDAIGDLIKDLKILRGET